MTPVAGPPLGLIEGFFGRTWSWDERRGYAGFLRDRGFGFYIYAPKADRHLRRDWRSPWPAATAAAVARAVAHYRAAGLSFGFGLSPFEAYRDDEAATRRALRAKVSELNQTGADWLCLLFDDMRGDLADLADRQAALVEEAAAATSADQVIVCPTYYSSDPQLERAFGAMPAGYLADLGRLLAPEIAVFWTGPRVCSQVLPDDHLRATADLLRRKPFLWDNHMTNDGASSSTRLALTSTLADQPPRQDLLAGHAINPMNQPWLSRIPLTLLAVACRGGDETHSTAAFHDACRALCDAPLAAAIARDQGLFQDQGLDTLAPAQRAALIADYEGHAENPLAGEIVAWLRGDYAFDPDCLTD